MSVGKPAVARGRGYNGIKAIMPNITPIAVSTVPICRTGHEGLRESSVGGGACRRACLGVCDFFGCVCLPFDFWWAGGPLFAFLHGFIGEIIPSGQLTLNVIAGLEFSGAALFAQFAKGALDFPTQGHVSAPSLEKSARRLVCNPAPPGVSFLGHFYF